MFDASQNGTKKLSLEEILNLSFTEKETMGLLHTPQEIFQQPETWQKTFQIVESQAEGLRNFLRESGLDCITNKKFSVTLIGAGTSDYIGRALVGLLRNSWKCHVEAVPSTDLMPSIEEFLTASPSGSKHLWISFSRSGDSFEGVKILETAITKFPQIRHLVVTCNENGKMKSLCEKAENAYCLILDKKVNDLGLAMTSSFTNMVIAGQCLANLNNLENYRIIIEKLAETAVLKMSEIAAVSQKIAQQDFTRICFLGDGALKSVAAESALKVMELTAGHYSVLHESFLGLRHGPLSWLNQKSLVVGFVSNDKGKFKIELDLLKELQKKNAAKSILVIAPNDQLEIQPDFKLILDLPDSFQDNYRPPLDILFAQSLGLFASLVCGLRPDSPSSDGKIQRVVSQIG